jgi:hypothetical protein
MPTYIIRDDDDKQITIGPVAGSTSYTLPPERQDPNFTGVALKTNDIIGCATSTKGLGNFHTRIRRGFLTTNVT